MDINTLPLTMNRDEAMQIAQGGGNLLGKLLYSKKDIDLRLMYLESREIVYELTYVDRLIDKFFLFLMKKTQQKIKVMVEGTRCNAAYSPDDLLLEIVSVNTDDVQLSKYTDKEIIDEGKRMCRRMIKRQKGRDVLLEVVSNESVFRPYYIAFYGPLQLGTKVRYLPIPADGKEVRREC